MATTDDVTYGLGVFRKDNSMVFQMQVVPGHENDILWTFDMLIIDGLVNLAGWFGLALSIVHNWFDKYIVDGIVNGLGYTMRGTGRVLRFVQSGRVENARIGELGQVDHKGEGVRVG